MPLNETATRETPGSNVLCFTTWYWWVNSRFLAIHQLSLSSKNVITSYYQSLVDNFFFMSWFVITEHMLTNSTPRWIGDALAYTYRRTYCMWHTLCSHICMSNILTHSSLYFAFWNVSRHDFQPVTINATLYDINTTSFGCLLSNHTAIIVRFEDAASRSDFKIFNCPFVQVCDILIFHHNRIAENTNGTLSIWANSMKKSPSLNSTITFVCTRKCIWFYFW